MTDLDCWKSDFQIFLPIIDANEQITCSVEIIDCLDAQSFSMERLQISWTEKEFLINRFMVH